MHIRKILAFLFVTAAALSVSAVAFAEEAGAEVDSGGAIGMRALIAGLTICVAASVGALSQCRAASVALEGIARNPGAAGKIFTPLLLSLALIESLVIYALIVAFMLVP